MSLICHQALKANFGCHHSANRLKLQDDFPTKDDLLSGKEKANKSWSRRQYLSLLINILVIFVFKCSECEMVDLGLYLDMSRDPGLKAVDQYRRISMFTGSQVPKVLFSESPKFPQSCVAQINNLSAHINPPIRFGSNNPSLTLTLTLYLGNMGSWEHIILGTQEPLSCFHCIPITWE